MNIAGLAIGLAISIMLILFVVNELSYDKHFANHKRIVRLLTVKNSDNGLIYNPKNLREAYIELPQNVPGVEAAVQLYNLYGVEVISEQKRFQHVKAQLADPEFFKVFQMKFVEGNAETSLKSHDAAVLTRRYANIMFGSPEAAMNQVISISKMHFVISGIVEELPKNTHFNFDVLGTTKADPWLSKTGNGLELFTYYLIHEKSSLQKVRDDIESAYRTILKPFGEGVGSKDIYGLTEMLGDVHLKSKASESVGNVRFINIITCLAFLILIIAVTNFINLYITQGEKRMQEIGIRKSYGAQISDIVKQIFSEILIIVGIAFFIGFYLAVISVPHFGNLIDKDIDFVQLLNPMFIITGLFLFVITVVLSAFYPAFYLSRFSPLEILGKRVKFSKRRLTAITVVFQ